MICKVKDTVNKYGLITDNIKTVAVGLSGGADSVCLVHLLSSLKDEYGIIIKAVHVNHNIRGEEADADEQFVRKLCDNMGIELLTFSVDVPFLAKERKLSLEECGRQVRYECFEKAGCDVVAVAHTLSDSIETMLFNLARGTGIKGLSGISPEREPNIIRPLINCTRDEIEAYCKENSLQFVTDSSNLSDDYTRNHIRHNIVPAFEKINGDFEGAFMRALNSVREADGYIEKCAADLLDESCCEDGYLTAKLASAHDVILKRCILEILKKKMNKPPEAKHIELCFDAVKAGKGKAEIAKDLYICISGDIITFHHMGKAVESWKSLFRNNEAETPFGTFILVKDAPCCADSFDADKIKNELFLSSRLEGDKFTFRNRGITKSLKKLFNERRIPSEKRNEVAVLHDGNNVVWIEDIGVNAMYIPDKNSQKIITVKRTGKNA